jgi:hypothetical protein
MMYFLCFIGYNKGIMNPFIYQVKKFLWDI